MRGIYGRGDVLAGAIILSVLVSFFTLTQIVRSADGSAWSSATEVNITRTSDVAVDVFNTIPAVPCEDQEFSWNSRTSGWVSSIVTTTYARCAVAMQDAYFETGSSVQGRIRSYSSKDKTFGFNFPALANVNVFAVPNSTSIVVNSWAYQNYYGGTSGLHIIRDYRKTMQDTGPDSAGNKIYEPAKPFDFELRGPDGGLVPIKPGGLKFSPNGEWMLVKTNYGGNLAWTRVNLETYEAFAFATPAQTQFSVQNAISNDGRYVVLYEPQSNLRVYDLEKCSNGTNKLLSQQCAYINIYDDVKAKLGVSEIQFRNFVFKGDRSMSAYITSRKAGESQWRYGEYILRYGEEITSNGYLAMGDSFSSGEGAYDYRTETNFYVDEDLYNLCHQSRSSYPYILNKTISFEWFGSVACSGAKMKDINFGSGNKEDYQKEDPQAEGLNTSDHDVGIFKNLTPGYREQHRFMKEVDQPPEVVTLSVGGNDIGFGDIVESCVNPLKSFINCYHDRNKREHLANLIDSQIDPLAGVYRGMKKQAAGPDFRLYVVGYPHIISTSGVCGLNVGMTDDERDFAFNLVNYLNEAIRIAAAKASVRYVDTSGAFSDGQNGRDYRLCGNQGTLAVNGLVLNGTTSKKPEKKEYQESYHPNLLGQSLLASTIDAATSSLSLAMPTESSVKNLPSASFRVALVGDSERHLGDGRVRYDVSLTSTPVVRGDDLQYSFSTGWSGAQPGTPIVLELHSTPIKIGETVVNVDGDVSGLALVPADIEPGYHELHAKYANFFGEPVDQYKIIFVRASAQDYDGDGVPNDSDPCIISAQSGVDSDEDGVDDACDDEYVKSAGTQTPSTLQPTENKMVLGDAAATQPQQQYMHPEDEPQVTRHDGGNVLHDNQDAPTQDGSTLLATIKNQPHLYEWVTPIAALIAVSLLFLAGAKIIGKRLS